MGHATSFAQAVTGAASAAILAVGLSTPAVAAEPISTPQAANCTAKFDAARGVKQGDCYSREEVTKFVCLDNKPGKVSPACGTKDAQLPVFTGKRFEFTGIVTSDVAKTKGFLLEKADDGYHVFLSYKNPQFNDIDSPNIPSFALHSTNPKIAAKYDPRMVAAECSAEPSAVCTAHDIAMTTAYSKGHRVAMGAVTQVINPVTKKPEDGKYLTLLFGNDGSATVDLTNQYGTVRMQNYYIPANIVADNLAAVSGTRTTAEAVPTAATQTLVAATNPNPLAPR